MAAVPPVAPAVAAPAPAFALPPDLTAAEKVPLGIADDAADTTFHDMFQSYHELGGTGIAWTDTVDWFTGLANNLKLKTATTCIVFTEKPIDLLVKGKTKKMNTDGVAAKPIVNVVLAGFLPKLTADDVQAQTAVQRAVMDARRADWPAEFRDVNVSKTRRVAFMVLQHATKINQVMKQWFTVYGNRPEHAVVPAKVVGETRIIKERDLMRFKQAKPFWNTAGAIEAFNFA